MDNLSEDLTCEPCRADGRQVEAEGFCLDCDDFLCSACLEIHLRPKPLRNHRLISVEEKFKLIDEATSLDAGFVYCNDAKYNDTKCESNEESHERESEDLDNCPKHTDKVVEYFCENHKELGCSVCMTLDHRLCKITYISKDFKTLEDIPDYRNFETEVKTLFQTLSYAKAVSENQKKRIKATATKAVSGITKLRNELVKCIDQSQRALLDEVKKTKTKDTKVVEENLKNLTDIDISLKKVVAKLIRQDIDNIEPTKLFLAVRESFDKVQETNIKVKTLTTKPVDINEYKFEPDILFTAILADDSKGLGCITNVKDYKKQAKNESSSPQKEEFLLQKQLEPVDKETTTQPETSKAADLPTTKLLDSLYAQNLTEINIRSVTDGNKCMITGMTMLENQKLALCDFQNSCLKIVDASSLYKLSLKGKLESAPYETAFSGKELYITQPKKATLAIFTDANEFKSYKYLAVGNECRGIAYQDGNIYISFNTNPGKIQVRKPSGEILRTFTSIGGDTFHHPYHLALHPSLPKLYVSDWQICILGFDGSLVRKHRDLAFKELRGLSVTTDGDLFVCDREGNAVYRIMPMVERKQIFVDASHGIEKPCAILATGKKKRKLFISMDQSDVIKVFQISKK